MDSSDEEVNSRRKETIELMRIENEELIKTCSDYEAYIAAKVTNEDLFYIEVRPLFIHSIFQRGKINRGLLFFSRQSKF